VLITVSSESDLQVLVWAYKHSRELVRRMPMYRGEFVPEHPKFPEGSEAVAKLADGPVPMNAPKIKYTKEDDKAIEEYVKQYSELLIWKSGLYSCILTKIVLSSRHYMAFGMWLISSLSIVLKYPLCSVAPVP